MYQKYLMIPALFALFAGLVSEAQAATLTDASNAAKVRVYQEADISLYPGEYCYGSNNPDAIHAARSNAGFFSFKKRENMPETGDIAGSYNEYVIPAGKPISVVLKWEAEKEGVKVSCGPVGSTFYPQPGKYYDVSMAYAGSCFVLIRELLETSPGKATATQTPASYSYSCTGQ